MVNMPLQGEGLHFQSLVGELRSHMPCGQKKNFFFPKICPYCEKKKKKTRKCSWLGFRSDNFQREARFSVKLSLLVKLPMSHV